MKPTFQLWDSDTANLVGVYETVTEALTDIEKTSTTAEARYQIKDLVLTLDLGGSDGDPMVILDGEALYRYGVERFAGTSALG